MNISNPLGVSSIAYSVYTNSGIPAIIEPSVGYILPNSQTQKVIIKCKPTDTIDMD